MSICAYQHVHVPRPEANLITWYLTYFSLTYFLKKFEIYFQTLDLSRTALGFTKYLTSNTNYHSKIYCFKCQKIFVIDKLDVVIQWEFFQFQLFVITFDKLYKWPNKKLNNVIMPSNKQFFPLLQFNYLLNQYADLKYKYLPSPTSSSSLQKMILEEMTQLHWLLIWSDCFKRNHVKVWNFDDHLSHWW